MARMPEHPGLYQLRVTGSEELFYIFLSFGPLEWGRASMQSNLHQRQLIRQPES